MNPYNITTARGTVTLASGQTRVAIRTVYPVCPTRDTEVIETLYYAKVDVNSSLRPAPAKLASTFQAS